jgi:hypothetical protein
MSGIPLVNQIPGLGQPLPMNFRAVKMVEHPQGLSFNAPNAGSSSGQLPQLPRAPIITVNQTSSTSAPTSTAPIWRTPNIYNQIAAAGETVVSTTVFSVNDALNWQAPGLTIKPGEQVWMDTNAVGSWQAGNVVSDANGVSSSSTLTSGLSIGSTGAGALASIAFYSKFPTNALIGYVGTPPTPMLATLLQITSCLQQARLTLWPTLNTTRAISPVSSSCASLSFAERATSQDQAVQ